MASRGGEDEREHLEVGVQPMAVVVQEHAATKAALSASVDDMALLRLPARDAAGVALVPSVVVRDGLRSGVLVDHGAVPDLCENFYAITVPRGYAPPLLRELLARPAADVLGAQ